MDDNEVNNNGSVDIPEDTHEVEDQEKEFRQPIHLSGMYKDWFLDYASYVILERAVPDVFDGLKPVHRRILHAMKELDDGRYNKCANIIGHTMKYHPHGDVSIGDALVQLGQKDLLIDTQGNWGNILTGDSAAAPRYIEARLSKFALEVVFNTKTTVWKSSYDGRNKEPVNLPVKFPLLLAQGVEGIAVGLASKILPHNFLEIIDASIRILQGKEFELLPDFPTGGLADFSRYNDGLRGGRVRVRARIGQIDKKTLCITDIPFGSTTSSLIDSVITANEKGKIKIRKIDDNTADKVEILIHLQPGTSPDTTIDALYAFTDCEVSISPNSCVIRHGHPVFLGMSEILKISTDHTVELLKKELEIRHNELMEQLHFSSLEKIFIEKEVYLLMKKCKTDEEIDKAIEKGLKPFADLLIRKVTLEDIHRLRKIPIDRISKYNVTRADEVIEKIRTDISEVDNHLNHLIDFAINYFRNIRKKYGAGKERKTEIRNFDTISAVSVAAANVKLYVNREEGFAGTSLKKDEYVCDCSDLDDLIAFRADGTFIVSRVSEKSFVGKEIVHIGVFKRNDDRTIYNMVYRDGKNGKTMIKRFPVMGVQRDKDYAVTRGTPDSRILYFTANPNGEAEMVRVELRPRPKLKKTAFDYDFSEVLIKSRSAMGVILSRFPVRKIVKREEGVSTLSSRDIWYDESTQRLNAEGRGILLGSFINDDHILTIMRSGHFRITGYDLSLHFDEDMILIGKYDPETVVTTIFFDGELKSYYVKRFQVELTDKRIGFLNEHPETVLVYVTTDHRPGVEVMFDTKKKTKGAESEKVMLDEFIGIKSYKAKGKKLTHYPVKSINILEPAEDEEEEFEEEEVADEDENGIDMADDEVMPDSETKPKEKKTKQKDKPSGKGQLELDL